MARITSQPRSSTTASALSSPTKFSALEEHVVEISKELKVEIKTPRCAVLYMGSAVGKLCSNMLLHGPPDYKCDRLNETPAESAISTRSLEFWDKPSPARNEIYEAIGEVFSSLLILSKVRVLDKNSSACKTLDLRTAILKKMTLNAEKYPVALSKGKSGKYTEYTHLTGITKEFATQSTLKYSLDHDHGDESSGFNGSQNRNEVDNSVENAHSSCSMDINEEEKQETLPQDSRIEHEIPLNTMLNEMQTVPDITRKIRDFAFERDWPKYHTPRNLVLAMLGEAGELAELFQFHGDELSHFGDIAHDGSTCQQEDGMCLKGWKEEKIDHVQQEIADVCIYLLRLADVVGIDDLGSLLLA